MVVKAFTGLKLAYSKAALKIPMKRELYTSFVINARTMAIIGGRRAQNVPWTKLWCSSPEPSAKTGSARKISTTVRTSRNKSSLLGFITYLPEL
jgi:hypothetical protein